jgi:hypothetical protein
MSHHLSFFIIITISSLLFAAPPSVTQTQTPPGPKQGRIDSSGKFVQPGKLLPGTAKPIQQVRDDDALLESSGVEHLGEGRVAIGEVVADANDLTISFPARVNMLSGLIEYALVNSTGKIHESLFSTDVKPGHIHIAALLIGMKPNLAKVGQDKGLVLPPEGTIRIDVSWKKHGPDARYPLEELILSKSPQSEYRSEKTEIPRESRWHYSGASFFQGQFLASLEGSIIALIPDQSALVNNPRPGRMDDEGHLPNQGLLPSLEKNVTITFHLPRLVKTNR